MDRGENRNKGKDRKRNRKLFPYRKGGKWRTEEKKSK